jgi:hypothetical protein|nr:MAG TPA: Putative coat protein [Caudoviricetes sp.]
MQYNIEGKVIDDKVFIAEDSSLANIMLLIESNKAKIAELEKDNKAQTDDIKEQMLNAGIKEVIVQQDSVTPLSALLYTRTSVSYDKDKMKAQLAKEQWKRIVEKQFVCEQKELKNFIKAHPDLKDEVKKFIKVQDDISAVKLDNALKLGFISLNDLKGTYEVKETNILKIQRKKL